LRCPKNSAGSLFDHILFAKLPNPFWFRDAQKENMEKAMFFQDCFWISAIQQGSPEFTEKTQNFRPDPGKTIEDK